MTKFQDLSASLDSLDDHLAFRTFLVGHDITAADIMVWGALKGEDYSIMPRLPLTTSTSVGNVKVLGILKNNRHDHLNRWFAHVESLESTQLALASLIGK